METPQLLLLVLLGLQTYTNCQHLPPYIKPCSRNDPNLNACAKEHALYAIPQLIKGDPKYRIPVLDPLQIEQLSVTHGSSNIGLSFTATNITGYGLKDMHVKDIRMDFKSRHIEYDLFIPNIEVYCRYNVSGQVLLLPITGKGNGVLLFKDVDLLIAYDFDIARKTAKGKEYLLPKNFTFKVEPHGMTVHLENLFNGNKLLGDNMNMILNENSKELIHTLAPPVGEALGQVAQGILTNVFELLPFDETYPEKV